MKKLIIIIASVIGMAFFVLQCQRQSGTSGLLQDPASKVYVKPGDKDAYYAFFSGGYSGQISVYGLPSGRQLRVIPVFSQDPEKAHGYNEETKPFFMTSYGFVPWDDAHHPSISQTDGEPDGRWIFINGNNTPRVARVDLGTFEVTEIIEIPHVGGNHPSAFLTENSEYLTAASRFSIPVPQKDHPLSSYKENFNGIITFISIDPETGDMEIAFQILVPAFNYDLAHAGKGVSHGWAFFTTYNVEKSHTLLEKNASQLDKDFIAAVNWKKAEEYLAQGKATDIPISYFDNEWDERRQMATSNERTSVKVLVASECPGILYYLPTPKSPHGVDVDPTGEYIVGSGKLSANISVHSYSKMVQAIENEDYETMVEDIPVLKYESVLAGIVEQPGLGPLHTEFDGRGNAYTSFFISSEVVKWDVETREVLDRIDTYYSIGHLVIPGGNSRKPFEKGKYLIALNKITKDRYLPTGPELAHSAQLFDISGDKMRLLLDFPSIGEPHYGQAILAEKILDKQVKIFPLEENEHPYVTKTEEDTKVVREGKEVRVFMTTIRTHFAPDNIEGIQVGDKVYFHITNLEQDWDVPHGFAILGANTSELLIMPGQTETLIWYPKKEGVFPFYCTDFCSALHQEMQGYVRVSATGANVPIRYGTGTEEDQ